MVKVLAVAELHDQMDMGPGVNDLIQAHDVLMLQVGQNVYLSMHSYRSLLVIKVFLLIDFKSYRVAGRAMDAPFDGGEGSRTNLKTHHKVIGLEEL